MEMERDLESEGSDDERALDDEVADTEHDDSQSEDTQRCNFEWDSDWDINERDRGYMQQSWELYAAVAEDEDDEQEGQTSKHQCPECSRDAEVPHFLLHVLHGRLCNDDDDDRATTQPDMVPRLWSSLPKEVLERVLAMLPAPVRIRLSVVCKQWHHLFFASPDFRKLCKEVETVLNNSAVCALEYQPGRLAPGCQPRRSDISCLSEGQGLRVYKIGLSFLPKKFQFFLPLDCVVQDGYVCIFRAQRSSHSGLKKLSFCVANLLTRSWKELPPQFCTCKEYELWRDDWTVCLEIRHDNFTVSHLSPRAMDGEVRMTVNTYRSETGVWQLTHLQNMRYIPPAYALEGEGKWPCYLVSGGFVCSGSYRQARLETMIHNADTGELVYCQDDMDNSEEDDLGDPPPLKISEVNGTTLSFEGGMDFPFKVTSNCNGFFCAARFFSPRYYSPPAGTRASEHDIEDHVEKALRYFFKQRRQTGYAIWKLDLSTGVWKQISVSPMPQHIKQKLMKRSLWNPFKPYRGHGPKDVRILFLDEAVISRDTVFLNIGIKEDYNFLVSDQYLRLWTGLVSYHIPSDSWKLIYNGLIPRLCGNEWHVFSPAFSDAALC